MTLPKRSAEILLAAGFTFEDYSAGELLDGSIVLKWTSPSPRPSDDQINAWATDATPLPSGQLFSVWLAENGGNAKKTRKRNLKRAFKDAINDDDFAVVGIRALCDIVADKLTLPRGPFRTLVLDRMLAIIDEGV